MGTKLLLLLTSLLFGYSTLAQTVSTLPDTLSNCDLVIKAYEQKAHNLELDIHASEGGLIPFDVELSQGEVSWTWKNLHHQSHRRFSIPNINTAGTATLKLISVGKPGCYASTMVVLQSTAHLPPPPNCTLYLRGYRQPDQTLEIDLEQGVSAKARYDIVLAQGDNEWTWNNVRYRGNKPIRLPKLPATAGPATLQITPRDNPGCQVQQRVMITGQTTEQKNTGLNNHTGRLILMNTTAWGFDRQDETGIAEPWRKRAEMFNSLTHQGQSFQALDGLRLLVRWYDYEPREGQFNDKALLAALNWCKANNMKFAICFWPFRLQNDNFLSESEWTRGMLGTPFSFEHNLCQPDLYSQPGREKLQRAIRHMSQVLAPYADDLVYISMAYGDTEEYFAPGITQSNPWRWTELTGYSEANRTAWKEFARVKGLVDVAPPVPATSDFPWNTRNLWTQTSEGRAWYQFITKGLREFHFNFRDAVKSGSNGKLKVAGFYADAGGEQSAWYMSYNLKSIFEGCDVIYSSEGESVSLDRKLMATDVNSGTFPGAINSIEFDPHDLSVQGGHEAGQPLNPDILTNYGGSFFRRGGNILHLAMAFSYGDIGRNHIQDLAPGLYYLRKELIEKAPEPLPSEAITVPLEKPEGDQFYDKWRKAGGSLNKQVKVIQDDLPFWK
ncbi:glycoside hydrolase family protein [Telluribacter humicola]|uniref:hypothetical protein n=1 Tax=Telluribacter humicola TaxID=1720261 RepID=UPI001A96AA85|nr:hypothetical protein [Telluribacter humicola]